MVIFYKKWKTYNEIQQTKNKMDLHNNKNHPPSRETRLVNLERRTGAVQREKKVHIA